MLNLSFLLLVPDNSETVDKATGVKILPASMKATVSEAKKDAGTLEPAVKSKTKKSTVEDTTTKENHPSSDSLLAGSAQSIKGKDHVKQSTSNAHRERKSSNDRSLPPLRCLSPKSPNSATSDNAGDWMPTLSPNNTSSPNDGNAMDDSRNISPSSDTPGTRKKFSKVVNADEHDSSQLNTQLPDSEFAMELGLGSHSRRRCLPPQRIDKENHCLGTLTPESDRPSEMMTPFTDPMTDGMMQLSDILLAGSDVDQQAISETGHRFFPPRSARICMKAEDQQKKLQKDPPVANELSGSMKSATPTRITKTKDYFDFVGDESIKVKDHVKQSTSNAHRERKSSNDRSLPPLRCLSPKSPNSATSDNAGDWMPTLSPNNTSSPNDGNAIDDTRNISPLSDTESTAFICDTPGTRKKSPKVVNVDEDDSRQLTVQSEAYFDNVDLPGDELERHSTNVVDDEGAAAAAREIERSEVGNGIYIHLFILITN